jgi:hypothetical protein
MDPKYVRTTVENLLADLLRNPGIGRPRSFMGRYGRPLGFGIALGLGGAAGCSDSSLSPARDADASVDARDALPAVADLPVNPDTRDALPPRPDLYGMTMIDLPPARDTRDALPLAPDAYGMSRPDGPPPRDTRDALPPGIDGDDVTDVSPADTRNALPDVTDLYGISRDTRDALPPAPDAYGIVDRPLLEDTKDSGSIDGGLSDGGKAD